MVLPGSTVPQSVEVSPQTLQAAHVAQVLGPRGIDSFQPLTEPGKRQADSARHGGGVSGGSAETGDEGGKSDGCAAITSPDAKGGEQHRATVCGI
jgi:hypothetical protein